MKLHLPGNITFPKFSTIRFYILPVTALFGIIFVIRTVIAGSIPPPVAPPVVEPARPPYSSFVAGSGIIESISENIAIASPLAGVIKAGDLVDKDQPLFSLDDRDALAELQVRQAQVERARAQQVDSATQLSLYQGVTDPRAIMRGELLKRESLLSIAKAALAEADSQVHAIQTTLDRMTIRSPLNGTVLQSKARVGEFAPAQVMTSPLMVVGTTSPLAVRVDVDENDAWRVEAGKKAQGTLRGNTQIVFPLTFVRFEPYVVPKRSLTGESTERVDTRVLQVIYSFEKKDLPIFVGQLVDVFIESSR
jgi:multidrug efflux pump subunit AcrA (membrane-fusion protein)